MVILFTASELNGIKNEARPGSKNIFLAPFSLLQTQKKNKIRESQDCLKKSSDALKCCAFVVQLIDATIVKIIIIGFPVKDWSNAHWKILEMNRWQFIVKYRIKQWVECQLVEDLKRLTRHLQLLSNLKLNWAVLP